MLCSTDGFPLFSPGHERGEEKTQDYQPSKRELRFEAWSLVVVFSSFPLSLAPHEKTCPILTRRETRESVLALPGF